MRTIAVLAAVSLLAGCNWMSSLTATPPDAAQPAAALPPPPPPPPPADPLKEAGLERVAVTIEGPLEQSVRAVASEDIASALSQVTARMLIWWIDVQRGLRGGDTVDIVYQRVPGKEPLLHAVRFYSGKNAREYSAYLYKPANSSFARYYEANGQEVEERIKNSPVDDYEQITSILRDGRRHKGVDFKTPSGTPVKAPFDLVVTRKNWNWRSNGNALELHDPQGRRVVFLHLNELPKSLTVGKRFRTGEVICESGNTGRSTAPHLHYQLESPSGKILDPFEIHETYRRSLDASETAAFQAIREKYDRMLNPQLAAPAAAAAAPAAGAPAAAVPAQPEAGAAPSQPAVAPAAAVPAAAAAPAPAPAPAMAHPAGAAPRAQ